MTRRLALVGVLLVLASPAAAQNPFSIINFGQCGVDTNSGNKSCGTLRVVLATDQPNLTTGLNVTAKIVDSGGTTVGDTTAHALKVLSVNGSGAEIAATTLLTHDGGLTPNATTGGALFCRASASAPTDVSASDDAVLPWCLLNGSGVMTLSAAGALVGVGAGGGLKIDGSGTALPVSFTMPALVAGAAIVGKVGIDQTTPGTTNGVSVTNASLAVTGTFWQATQPVSGTFWQATQPVSGTFWQGTQPVSLAAPTTVTQGQKTVAVTNTAVALATTTTIKSVTAKALAANVGAVYVGGSGVTTANGFALNPNDTVSLGIADLATVFINGTSGDGVSFVAVN